MNYLTNSRKQKDRNRAPPGLPCTSWHLVSCVGWHVCMPNEIERWDQAPSRQKLWPTKPSNYGKLGRIACMMFCWWLKSGLSHQMQRGRILYSTNRISPMIRWLRKKLRAGVPLPDLLDTSNHELKSNRKPKGRPPSSKPAKPTKPKPTKPAKPLASIPFQCWLVHIHHWKNSVTHLICWYSFSVRRTPLHQASRNCCCFQSTICINLMPNSSVRMLKVLQALQALQALRALKMVVFPSGSCLI